MSVYSELPIYNNLFFLLKDLYVRIPKFSKQYKYFLGEKILQKVSDSIVLVYKISISKNSNERIEYAGLIAENMQEALVLIRIAHELQQFENKDAYFFLVQKIVVILDQAKKWKSFFQKKSQNQ